MLKRVMVCGGTIQIQYGKLIYLKLLNNILIMFTIFQQ
jgi:hypothetical protein